MAEGELSPLFHELPALAGDKTHYYSQQPQVNQSQKNSQILKDQSISKQSSATVLSRPGSSHRQQPQCKSQMEKHPSSAQHNSMKRRKPSIPHGNKKEGATTTLQPQNTMTPQQMQF